MCLCPIVPATRSFQVAASTITILQKPSHRTGYALTLVTVVGCERRRHSRAGGRQSKHGASSLQGAGTCRASHVPALTLRSALFPPLSRRLVDQKMIELLPTLDRGNKPTWFCAASSPGFAGWTSAARLAAIPAGESPANRGVQTLL